MCVHMDLPWRQRLAVNMINSDSARNRSAGKNNNIGLNSVRSVVVTQPTQTNINLLYYTTCSLQYISMTDMLISKKNP